MKRMALLFSVVLSYVSYSNVNAQCTLACLSEVNLALDASGHATIAAEDVLASYGPACGTLVVEPSSFDCSDIGAPILYTVTDLASGNICWGYIQVFYFVGAISCYANLNVNLGSSGTLTLTPDMLLFDPPGACIPGAIISPSTVSCADIGTPVVVTITDPVSGNSCWSYVTVSYSVGAMSCYANLNVNLGSSGTLTLTPGMLLFDPPGACIPGAIISPSTVSCADIGTPVVVTITDPVSGNSCWSTVDVEDPTPSSCEIIIPASILCGDSGVPFSVMVSGGYGPFQYTWEIKGNPHGWSILTGQGTDNITMAVGEGKIKLEVTITDVCGKKQKCSVKPECVAAGAFFDPEQISLSAVSPAEVDHDLELFPNPATHSLWVNFPEGTSTEKGEMYIVDQHARRQVSARYQQNHKGKMSIDVVELQPGIYWLILEDVDGGPRIKKFIKL